MLYVLGIIALGGLIVAALRLRLGSREERELRALKHEYRRRLGEPAHLADESLQWHLTRLQEKHPGRSQKWYLEKVISDLQRDRR